MWALFIKLGRITGPLYGRYIIYLIMFRKLNLLMFVVLSGGLSACTTMGKNRPPAVASQVETRLVEVGLANPQIMTIYHDSLLLVVNNLNQNPHHVRVFDIAGRKAVNNLLPVGSGRGGTLSFMSFGIAGNRVWAFDVAKNGFIVGDLDTVLSRNAGIAYYTEYRIKPQVFFYDAVLLNRQEALFSGNYDTDEKLLYVNFQDSTKNKKLLSYVQDSSIGTSMVRKMAYESFMLLRPDQQKLVLACRYADQFELVDLVTGKHHKIKGAIGFAPQLEPFESNTGTTVATPGYNTLYGFLKGHVTGQYIYLLFSGYHYQSHHRFYGNKIRVYDWEGNFVRQIVLKNDIVDFAVTANDKTLYTLDPQIRAINTSSLTW